MKVLKTIGTLHDFMPNKFKVVNLGGKTFELTLNENIEEISVKDDEGNLETKYQSDEYIGISKFEDNKKLKAGLISLKYSIAEEIALKYKDEHDQEFIDYRNYVDECKAFVNENVE